MDIEQYIQIRIQVWTTRVLCCRLMLRFARGGMPLGGREWGRGRNRWQEKVAGRFLHKTAVWQLFCPQSALLGLIILVFWPLGTSNTGYAIKNS
ncbi:hypothetical protein ACLKQF_16015, partial [Aeromonas salmonicida]